MGHSSFYWLTRLESFKEVYCYVTEMLYAPPRVNYMKLLQSLMLSWLWFESNFLHFKKYSFRISILLFYRSCFLWFMKFQQLHTAFSGLGEDNLIQGWNIARHFSLPCFKHGVNSTVDRIILVCVKRNIS